MYTDPSGEVFQIGIIGAVAIGAAIAATSYTIYALATTWDNFSWGGLLKSTLIGAVSGAASFGVGQLASQMFTGICASTSTLTASQVSWIVAAPQAVMHGISQGFIAGISGGDLGQAFFSGMISSGVSSVVQMGGSSFMGNGDAATLLFGTVSGGLSAELTGGNFWEGAATGLTVSGLNHVAHKIAFEIGKDPDIPDLTKEFKQQLRETRKFFKNLKNLYDLSGLALGPVTNEAMRMEAFRTLTTDGGKFDLKNLDDGNGTFGYRTLKNGAYYKGELFRFDDFGNYNFGVAANAYGYSLKFVQFAAGINQMTKFFEWQHWTTFFDDPRDYKMIERGYNLEWK